jgi:hypothetical protein
MIERTSFARGESRETGKQVTYNYYYRGAVYELGSNEYAENIEGGDRGFALPTPQQ